MKPISTRTLHTSRLMLRVPQVDDAADLVAAGSLLTSVEDARMRLADTGSSHWTGVPSDA